MEEEDDYVEYVPMVKRRAIEAQKILQRKGKTSALEEELKKSKLAEAKPSQACLLKHPSLSGINLKSAPLSKLCNKRRR